MRGYRCSDVICNFIVAGTEFLNGPSSFRSLSHCSWVTAHFEPLRNTVGQLTGPRSPGASLAEAKGSYKCVDTPNKLPTKVYRHVISHEVDKKGSPVHGFPP